MIPSNVRGVHQNTDQKMNEVRTFKVSEVAFLLHCNEATVRRRVGHGDIRATKSRRGLTLTWKDLTDYDPGLSEDRLNALWELQRPLQPIALDKQTNEDRDEEENEAHLDTAWASHLEDVFEPEVGLVLDLLRVAGPLNRHGLQAQLSELGSCPLDPMVVASALDTVCTDRRVQRVVGNHRAKECDFFTLSPTDSAAVAEKRRLHNAYIQQVKGCGSYAQNLFHQFVSGTGAYDILAGPDERKKQDSLLGLKGEYFDFVLAARSAGGSPLIVVELKNRSDWIFGGSRRPDKELMEFLSKLNGLERTGTRFLPVFIARRLHASGKERLARAGAVYHETGFQYFPETAGRVLEKIKPVDGLGLSFVEYGNAGFQEQIDFFQNTLREHLTRRA